MASDEKCAHPACGCAAADDSDYCSPHCTSAQDNVTELACGCGHDGCAA